MPISMTVMPERGRVFDMDAFLLILKAIPATSVERGPRGSVPAVCEIRPHRRMRDEFREISCPPFLMLVGLRGDYRGR